MNLWARIFVVATIAFHLLAFVAEAWIWPAVAPRFIDKLNPQLTTDVATQAAVLATLFVNQGFYNLFLALGGIAGLVALARGREAAGLALMQYVCAFAVGAGIVLLVTTAAHAGGILQAGLAGAALLLLHRGREAHGAATARSNA